MRFVDFLITIPSIIIGSVIGYHFGNLGATFLALYLVSLPGPVYRVRTW
jgi:peptide/nickel transport system permease protein